ncbi:MAG: DUF1015 domain-containing protein [bacterium]
MVAIAPFRALRYSPTRINLATSTSPPHDCVTADEADGLRRGDEHNILHIALPPAEPGDGDTTAAPSKYSRAGMHLREWMHNGVLVRDARPGLYLYQVTTGPLDDRRTMSGFFARLALDATGTQVRPHEHTLQRPKRDRLHLREATGTDVEAIWLLYRDPRGWVHELLESNAFDEVARFTDEAGSEHRLWRVDRYEAVTEITAQFDDRELVIADGHHRYRTALEQFAATGRPEHGSILVCLVRDNDPGLRIEATHRLVHGLPRDADAARQAALDRNWDAVTVPLGKDLVYEAKRLTGLLDDGRKAIVVGRANGGLGAQLLTLKPSAKSAAPGRLATLAVTRVHEFLLAPWGVAPERPEQHLRYARDAAAALHDIEAGLCQYAVLLPPEPVDAVLDVAEAGQLMPQKATYFVPKLRSGLVLSLLDEPIPRGWKELAGDGGRPEFRLPPLG